MASGSSKRRKTTDDDIREQTEMSDFIDLAEDDQNIEAVASATQAKKSRKDDKAAKPLLEEVTFVATGNSKITGGTKVWVCNHCKGRFTSSYTRIHTHFFGTIPRKKPDIQRCSTILKDREKYAKLMKKVKEAINEVVSKSLKHSVINKSQIYSSKKPLEEAFGTMERSMVDLKIIRGLCANGIPFNVLRNPLFREMVSAINNAPARYIPPSYEKARTGLLDECVRDVEGDLLLVKDTWFSQGVSIMSDGWSNVKHNPLINVIAVNSRGAMFMYAEDFSGVEKTGKAISEFLAGAIESVGPNNVLQVVTDNAANCKAAGKELEKVYKHIFLSPCSVHTLNLIFKDLANSFCWLMDTYKRGKTVVKYFLNHTHALAIFRENSKLELLKVAKTRFASHYILLKRLMDCREALSTTVVRNTWRDWVKQGDENTRRFGQEVTETIKSDEFWIDVESILAVTKPIFLMVKFCDGEGPKMGEIYEKMDNMLGEIKDVMKENLYAPFYNEIERIILARWEKMTIPLHCKI